MGRNDNFLQEEVLRLYADGQRVEDIIQQVDMSYQGVLRLLKKKGVYKARTAVRAQTVKQQVEDLLEKHVAPVEIAQQTHLPLTVINATRERLEKTNKKYCYAGKTFDTYAQMQMFKINMGAEIRKLAGEGFNTEQMAARFNISILSVARFLQ